MKRLFRNSKAGTIDPLPPPPPQQYPQHPQHPQHPHDLHSSQPLPYPPHQGVPNGQTGRQIKKSMTEMLGGNGHSHHGHEGRPRQGSVTPFPIDAGRETPPPQSNPPSQHHSRKKDKSSISSPPTLLEIQQMQGVEGAERDNRRDQWVSQQRSPPPPPPQPIIPPPRKFYEQSSSPDGWTIVDGRAQSPSNASTPIAPQPALFLPPGARPPSPQIRPGTPTRQGYSTSLGHSQTSAMSNPFDVDHVQTTPRVGRDRGYSSASGSVRGSDHESSAHGHPTSPHSAMPIPKPSQPIGTRSPLSHAYASPVSPDHGPQYATAPPPTQAFPSAAPNTFPPIIDGISAIRIEGPSPEAEMPRDGGKEKKKFWGMGMDWGKKEKEKSSKKELERPSNDEPRRSFECRTEEKSSNTGHTDEDGHRGRMLGLDIGRFSREPTHQTASTDSVTTAIQILCAHPDPPVASIYEVCDRINHSAAAETVGKEAAHALRKQFKHGNDQERKAAANLWLLMMKNVSAKGFRSNAISKKFVSVLEPLLLAPPAKPILSPATHDAITHILADLTYHFGQEKGAEGLVELWKKLKLPQEPDTGVPLPTDFTSFPHDRFYANRDPGSFDSAPLPGVPSSYTGSRRPSSPNGLGPNDRSAPLPQHNRAPSPLHNGGPGYAHLPSHGDDIRRLVEECTAAKESARVLAEALVYTRPHELDSKPIIREFYRKCFLAHESLTNQIDWAQAEASQSREQAIMDASAAGYDPPPMSTPEEQALGTLFEAHSQLAEALKQHDDLERLARDESELREVRERSKKETRMDRSQGFDTGGNLLAPGANGSTSRSPSPTPYARLPVDVSSPRKADHPLPMPRPFSTADSRSRTPSPDRYPHPKLSQSPARAASPLGGALPKTRGPRPLPNPFSRGQNASTQSLTGGQKDSVTETSRSATGSTGDYASAQSHNEGDNDDPPPPAKPSRKALGKRRAIEDPDNHFNPDDMFGTNTKESSASSDESVTADDVFFAKPVTYAYDAYQEKLDAETAQNSRDVSHVNLPRLGGGSGGGSAPIRTSVEAR